MRAMPGPLVSAECFVGREDFIEQLLKRLGSSSIILYGMRRLGKTSVLKAIHEQHPPDLTMVYQNCDPIQSPEDFWRRAAEELSQELSKRGKHAILKRALGSLADTLSSSLSTTKAYEPKGPGQEAVRRFIACLKRHAASRATL